MERLAKLGLNFRCLYIVDKGFTVRAYKGVRCIATATHSVGFNFAIDELKCNQAVHKAAGSCYNCQGSGTIEATHNTVTCMKCGGSGLNGT